LWGPGDEPENILVVGGDFEDLQALCEHAEVAAHVPANPYVMPYEDNLAISLCSKPKVPLATLWPRLKHYL
ncbi:MAG: glycosyltransferase family 39 protein, partial [Archangium sp.]